tara:strand:+ start:200 stop:1273 length:1074 start_codon:yes stop_codon:yes gene_type:complete
MINLQEIYSEYKLFKYTEVLKKINKKEISPPVHIRIKPTNICNHDCWYCAYRTSNLELGNQMKIRDQIPFDKFNEIADDIVSMGVKAVTFSGGGEPLLYKKLPLIIKKMAKGGVKIGTLTNGSNLKGNMAAAFQKYGSWVRISLDGFDDKSYSKVRGVRNNAFSQLLENIKNFTSINSECIVGCAVIVDHINYTHIYKLCSKLKSVGVQNVKISGVVVGNIVEKNNQYHYKIKNVVSNEIKKCNKLIDNKFLIINHYHDLNSRFDKDYNTCPFIFYRPVIGADSMVYTCQDKAYTKSGALGSIKNKSFKEFWFSEIARNKIYKINPEVLCNHHCISHSKNKIIHQYLNIDEDHSCFT